MGVGRLFRRRRIGELMEDKRKAGKLAEGTRGTMAGKVKGTSRRSKTKASTRTSPSRAPAAAAAPQDKFEAQPSAPAMLGAAVRNVVR
jgi:hypothetical protein